jgi:two-component system phosphate regulon sensor histidine kinase PhoR
MLEFRLKLFIATTATALVTLLSTFTLARGWSVVAALAAALLIAWRVWAPMGRRLTTVIRIARHYASADLPRWPGDYGDDDVGQIVRAMDQAVQEQRRRLADLGRHRVRMEAILSEMAEGVMIVDRQGRIQLINEVARRLLPGRVTAGDHYIETVRHPGIVEELSGALRGERPDPLEVTLADGRRSLSAHATPASDAAGGGAVLVLHDITALRTADRIRRDFVANVSHELRTPLTAVRGYIEALQDDMLGSDERREFLGVVARHTNRMERLVRDLLRLARIEAGQEVLDMRRCDVKAMFGSLEAELDSQIRARQLTVDTEVEREAAVVMCDTSQLHDALRNLFENAINYSPEMGRIELSSRIEGEHVALSVADQGPGIPESDLERIFERFYRVDKSRTQAPGGTGLGLSIVKHLVELHGGRVAVTNRQPHGAVFKILLPTNLTPR